MLHRIALGHVKAGKRVILDRGIGNGGHQRAI
jgi:hypothetical protein